jgi:formamidopyrimidine-DNA glycosylase
MPEINEVKRYADFLRDKIQNKKLEDIKILKGRYKTNGPFELYNEIIKELPLTILDVQTKGKFIYISLEKDYFIFNTLGLKGGWTFYDKTHHFVDQYYEDKHDKSVLNNLNVEFKTKNGSAIFYDQLSFGTLKIVKGKAALNKKLNTLGPDIMDVNTTFNIFKNQLKKKQNLNKAIGNVIVNQKIISGIGNYLRSDVLWMSKINPFRKTSTLTDDELLSIYKNILILTWGDYNKEEAIKLKLITKNSKLPSDYNRNFFVYKQEKIGDIHKNKIEVDELYEGSQKRVVYWCPAIQK